VARQKQTKPRRETFALPQALEAYLRRIGAEVLNFKRAMVKEYQGNYYIERVLIQWDGGEIRVSKDEYAPTKEEKAEIERELLRCTFPQSVTAKTTDRLLPEVAASSKLFELYDRASGEIIMVQERREHSGKPKSYHPWSYWSDGQWRNMEPEGPLPFWKPKTSRGLSRFMIHEGAKPAAFLDDLINNPDRREELERHPWRDDIVNYEHWGMIGGALSPHRTNYLELHREQPMEVIYVCDNDWPGRAALQDVSRYYGRSMKGVRFDQRWKDTWDLADQFPPEMFAGEKYIGPRFKSLIQPATRATERIYTGGKGKGEVRLLRDFREEWFHCVRPEVFVHKDWPDRILAVKEFNNWVSPYSDVKDTATLLMQDGASKSAVLKYSPALPSGIFGSIESGLFCNTHVPSPIEAVKKNPQPFLDYIEHLIPVEKDRIELLRWLATLIARPDIKMLYGVLLISEMQGVGKGTLGERILAPLMGEQNVSYPSEGDIVDSNYNYWLAHKRLAVVHEIYAGHSAKAYNRLKSIITDRTITVNQKYLASYDIENWVHILACSNSMRALKLSNHDRRWFVPKVTEERRGTAYWEKLNYWLSNQDGLGAIKNWAKLFLKEHAPVERGDSAPISDTKLEIIKEGYSPGMRLVSDLLERTRESLNDPEMMKRLTERGYVKNGHVIFLDNQLVQFIKDELYEGHHNDRIEKPATIRKLAKAEGWYIGETRAKVKDWLNCSKAALGARIISTSAELASKPPGVLCNDNMKPDERLRPLDPSIIIGL